MTARRVLFVAAWIVVGVLAIAATVDRGDASHPARAWIVAVAVAGVALAGLAVTVRPTLQRAGTRPARDNPRLSWWAVAAAIAGAALADILRGYTAIAFCGVAVGGGLGLLIWTPTLGRKTPR